MESDRRHRLVQEAFARIDRQAFCLPEYREHADEDRPLPIGYEQTISQPSLVAYMTEVLEVEPRDRALEIGTGSGFQAALLAELGAEVYTIERIEALAERARCTLREQGYEAVHVRHGDGIQGWPEAAPFDIIIVSAAAETSPPALFAQLHPARGRLLVPEGSAGFRAQTLALYRKTPTGDLEREALMAVRFVPLLPGLRPADENAPEPE